MEVLAVVMAKANSTRLPNKNLLKLGDKTLVEHAILAAQKSELITKVAVSTDSDRIGEIAKKTGAVFLRRPDSLCTEFSDIKDAAKFSLECSESKFGKRYDYVVTLQAATPIRPFGAIDALILEMKRNKANGGLSMVRRSPWIWTEDKSFSTWFDHESYPRSQDIKRVHFEEINCIQVCSRRACKAGKRWDFPLSIVEIPQWAGIDIDTAEDYESAKDLWPLIRKNMSKEQNMKTNTFFN